MDLNRLSNFVTVVEMQSLSKAAAAVRIAQPALSRQIRAMEDYYGAPLLARHGWGVTPTAAGLSLLDHARRILREERAARDSIRAMSGKPTGSLALGVPSSLARVLLPRVARIASDRFPELRLQLIDGYSASLYQWLIGGKLDMAILYRDRSTAQLAISPLLSESLVAIGPAGLFGHGQMLHPDALAQHRLILPGRPNRLRFLIEGAITGYSESTCPGLEVDSLPALLDLVRSGAGISVLPYSAVHDLVREGSLSYADLGPPALERILVLAHMGERPTTPAIEAIGAVLHELVAADQAECRWTPACA